MKLEPFPGRDPDKNRRKKDRYLYGALGCLFGGILTGYLGLTGDPWLFLVAFVFLAPVYWLIQRGR